MATSYLSPGVYIEETPSGPKPISAAPTSVLAVVGTTSRGPHLVPTRLTGWADYQRVFGDSVAGSYTAEAVYGFFANGGPAAWVVRADPSILATWRVRDAAGDVVFEVEAAAPGSWANTLKLGVSPDTGGGNGITYFATITADINVTAGANTLAVSSTAGVQVGDRVQLETPNGTRTAQVTDIGDGQIDVDAAGALNVTADAGVVYGHVAATDSSVRLATMNGLRAGDVLQAVLPTRQRIDQVITDVAPLGPGGLLTLQGTPAEAIPGGAFAPRTATFSGVVNTPGDTVALSAITWGETLAPTRHELANGFQLTTASGLTGRWATNRYEFPVTAGAEPFTAEAQLVAHVFSESIRLDGPAGVDVTAELTDRFGFLADGMTLQLANAGGGATATVTRDSADAAGWTTADDLTAEIWETVTFVLPSDASDGVVVRCARPPEPGDWLDVNTAKMRITGFSNPGGNLYVLEFDDTRNLTATGVGPGPFELWSFQQTRFVPLRFSLTVQERGETVERYENLALGGSHGRFYARDEIINDVSERIRVGPPQVSGVSAAVMPAFAAVERPGAEVPASGADLKEAFRALELPAEPAMVICPDAALLSDELLAADVIDTMLTHAQEFRRYAIVDTPNVADPTHLKTWRETVVNSKFAGVYAPWVRIANLRPAEPQRIVDVPPSGFVAGVFARTDRERGVHKAPANERVRGIVGLAHEYTQRHQDLLNPASVNLIRSFPGRGNRIWGARNATDDTTWRYVNVRRLFNMIETSVERSTQWVVFEPNTPATWLRIRVSVENFLDQLWRAGAFAGTSAQEAYRVRVGLGETMTETDLDQGLVVTEVAVAPAKPAEFVVFRFSHKRLSE